MIRPIAALLTLAGILTATEVKAQHLFRRGNAGQAVTYAAPAPTPTPAIARAGAPSRVYSYSYFTRSSLPARTYVGYGTQDFPFHGTPYGHPYDPYTWNAMAGSNASALARYYDPPVK
jgi:hypothetical protein